MPNDSMPTNRSPSNRREIIVRGKAVRFSSRILKSGEVAYYRDGKRVKTGYQRRIAKGVLEGKTLQEARGHPFGAYSGKLATKKQISEQFLSDIGPRGGGYGEWAARPGRRDGGAHFAYYVKVSVKSESLRARGSPDGSEEACKPVTLRLLDPNQNTKQPTFTYAKVVSNFQTFYHFTLQYYQLETCSDDPKADLLMIWRHKEAALNGE